MQTSLQKCQLWGWLKADLKTARLIDTCSNCYCQNKHQESGWIIENTSQVLIKPHGGCCTCAKHPKKGTSDGPPSIANPCLKECCVDKNMFFRFLGFAGSVGMTGLDHLLFVFGIVWSWQSVSCGPAMKHDGRLSTHWGKMSTYFIII